MLAVHSYMFRAWSDVYRLGCIHVSIVPRYTIQRLLLVKLSERLHALYEYIPPFYTGTSSYSFSRIDFEDLHVLADIATVV